MPTGYTAIIENKRDVTFKEFCLGCAKAFIAYFRDAPSNAPFKLMDAPDVSYWESNIKTLKNYTFKNYISDLEEEIKSCEESILNKKACLERYNKMQAEVKKWNPPTPNHNGLKNFMASQINDSIGWDCDFSYYEKELVYLKNKLKEAKKLKKIPQDKIDRINEEIKDNEEEIEKEKLNVEKTNKWITELLNSLN